MKYVLTALAVILAALVGILAASCGAGSNAESAGPVPTAEAGNDTPGTVTDAGTDTVSPPEGSTTSAAAPHTVTYQVWLTKGDSLYMVTRIHDSTPRIGSAAMESLLEGPDTPEAAAAIGSQIPSGTQLLGLSIDDGVATVDLSSEYESGGGSASMNMRIAQVVYTLTQFPTVNGVLFKLDGQPVDVLGGEGVIVDHPVTRRDYRELLPAIVVRSPEPGSRVPDPVTVSGTANVFEANVSVDVVDSAGRTVGSAFTTASCGTGCRGTFSVTVPYDVSSETRGLIIVHDDDAAGTGKSPHEVRIPVVLTPSS